MPSLESMREVLHKKGFKTSVFADAKEAKKAALELIGEGSVGIGGSMTIKDMGIYDELISSGNEVSWHWREQDALKARSNAMVNDFYLSGANALCENGSLVNIDGFGNRVMGMVYGCQNVIIFIGKNKIVKDYNAAISRIKTTVCPQNARRLGYSTPCAKTGQCADCNNPNRMCRVTTMIEYPPHGVKNFYIYLINENLGY